MYSAAGEDTVHLLRLVSNFLENNGYAKTSQTMKLECVEKKVDLKSEQNKSDETKALFRTLSTGEHEQFFHLWDICTRNTSRANTTKANSLEFYIRIYFATYPMKTSTSTLPTKKKSSYMDQLKNYLETPSATQFRSNPEFMPYFDLPYEKHVQNHPFLKQVLRPEFSEKVKQKLKTYLSESQVEQKTEIVTLPYLLNYFREKDTETKEIQLKCEHYKKKVMKLQTDYQKVIAVASDLVDGLEQTIRGKPISSKHLQDLCARMLENQESHRETLRNSSSPSLTSKAPDDPEPTSGASTTAPSIQSHFDEIIQEPIQLNFDSLKTKLKVIDKKVNNREMAYIFQALRLVLTESSKKKRDLFLSSLINKDIFDVSDKKGEIFNKMYIDFENETKEQMSRLINTIASMKTGRSYLIRSKVLLNVLQSCVKTTTYPKIAVTHIVVSLQKLSLRRSVQMQLVKNGFVSWLLDYLDNSSKLTDYPLEYGCALLMNLSLTTLGKKAATENPEFILKLLSDLIKHENKQIRPYINGTLYSVLSMPNMRHKARKTDLCHLLDRAVQQPKNPNDIKQIPYVIKQLNGELADKQPPPSDDELSTTEEDEDEEEDYLEPELNSDNTLRVEVGQLTGLALLQVLFPVLQQGTIINAQDSSGPTVVAKSNGQRKWAPGNTYTVERKEKATRQNAGGNSTILQKNLSSSTFTVKDASKNQSHTVTDILNARTKVASENRQLNAKKAMKSINANQLRRNSLESKTKEQEPTKTSTQSYVHSDVVRKLKERRLSLDKMEAVKVVSDSGNTKVDAGKGSTYSVKHVTNGASGDQLKNAVNVSVKAPEVQKEVARKTSTNPTSVSIIDEEQYRNGHHQTAGGEMEVSEVSAGFKAVSTSNVSAGVVVPGLIAVSNTRIPEDTTITEYMTVFGSRPKIARTPDTEMTKKRNGTHFMIFN